MHRLLTILLSFTSLVTFAQPNVETYCNPINIDYTYMIYNSKNDISYRSGADPAVVKFRGEYYMFVTRSLGYWHSTDLQNWDFIQPEKWYFEGCNAPAAHNYKDSVLYVTGNPSGHMSMLYTDNPKKGDWKIIPAILNNLQDPDLFIDDDDQAYMFWGSSNVYPIRGKKLDRKKRFIAEKDITKLFNLDAEKHGWERFGENNSDTIIAGYIEGAWMTKHDNTYYMLYAAPGTEWNVYADGVYTAKNPLGPYTYQAHNPVVYKPGGFMNGAGHGSIVKTTNGTYWHFGSMALAVNERWERRICMHPIFFDKDGIIYSDTRFGDYPHFAPSSKKSPGAFRGWMLLSYQKPVTSSTSESSQNIDDENVKTFWLSKTNKGGEWITIDMGKNMDIKAIQINFHDYQSNMYGRYKDLHHRYLIEASNNGTDWKTIVDKSKSFKDTPNDYAEINQNTKARYIRYTNIEIPTPHLAISDIRVFGNGLGKLPNFVHNFKVIRQKDRRDVKISWKKDKNNQGCNIIWGIAPDKLYNNWMVYGDNELLLKSLSKDQTYYFTIEAFNENGISKRTNIIEIKY
ncbi:family 43 glycosylhydrolase [Ancylomarina longa]|uniref:1,4-beta-xylanase n=1 Tax=Ancylomarina longa TaxID=2487017 RepID=A0A434AV76_9BACT|nr:family 43 glycosylhydrolase [Ancylomarina longa]RUT78266.1 1,4-beta-xylanase [Ancylomarina longa]